MGLPAGGGGDQFGIVYLHAGGAATQSRGANYRGDPDCTRTAPERGTIKAKQSEREVGGGGREGGARRGGRGRSYGHMSVQNL